MNVRRPEQKPGRIITFYSYKGGVGRSFALANIAAILAQWGARVLCVDWDLEAPGLHHFFPELIGKESPNGLLDLLESAKTTKPAKPRPAMRRATIKTTNRRVPLRWQDCLNTARVGATGKSVDLIVAGQDADDYAQRVHGLNWEALYAEYGLGEFLERMRQEWTAEYDYVLLDSRTGLTDIGGVCTIHLPDIIVSVFTANQQSMQGTEYMARRINVQRRDFFYSSGQALILPLLSRWEEKDAPEDAKAWLPRVLKTVRPSFNQWRDPTV
ncbi:MAG: AAA family ATPase, partial [Xanthomonadales bacterium]|nr:AAA family ATPase [Xanthomonadales bacterium]